MCWKANDFSNTAINLSSSYLSSSVIPEILKVRTSHCKIVSIQKSWTQKSAPMLFDEVVQTLNLFQTALNIFQFVSSPTPFSIIHYYSNENLQVLMLEFSLNTTDLCVKLQAMERSSEIEESHLFIALFFLFSSACYCNYNLRLGNPATSVDHFGATETQLVLLSELIYNVEASDDPNLMARPFCPAVRWKTL